MKLKRGGSVFDVTHPSEIARLKRAGFTEVTDEQIQADAQAAADAAVGAGSQTVEPEQEGSESKKVTKKGKGK